MGRNQPPVGMLLAGIGVGAAIMYFLDPGRGGTRRARVRDRTTSTLRAAKRGLQHRAAALRHRAGGTVAELRHLAGDHPANEQLVARVRAELGHRTTHARAIDVTAADGAVTLRGPVLRDELDGILATVRGVRGVTRVDNELDVHTTADGVPSLQEQG